MNTDADRSTPFGYRVYGPETFESTIQTTQTLLSPTRDRENSYMNDLRSLQSGLSTQVPPSVTIPIDEPTHLSLNLAGLSLDPLHDNAPYVFGAPWIRSRDRLPDRESSNTLSNAFETDWVVDNDNDDRSNASNTDSEPLPYQETMPR
jgi:hypothetical protein